MGTGRFNAGVDSVELLVRQLSRDGRPYRDGLMALGALAALRLGYLSSRFMWRLVRQMAGPWTGSQPQAVDFSARCGQWAVLINPCKGLGFALALALAQRHVNLLLVDFNEHALELFKEYIQRECDGKIEIISVTCGLKLHSENLAAQEIAETIRKMNIRLLFNICGFPHKEHQKSADDISMTPQISSFLTFHSKIALTSQLIFEMLVQSQRNENGSTVFNIGAYYPNYGSQDWTEFRALQSYGTGLQELSERDGSKSRLNIVGVQYINYFTRNGSAASSIWSSYMGYLLPTAKSYATSLLAKLERGREHQLAVSWRHSMIMGILNLCPYLYFPSP